VKVARDPAELEQRPRAVALGTFDGVHLGHRRVLEAAVAAGLTPTAVTFDPHPRVALGYDVELLAALDRRLELIAESGVEDALVVDFGLDVAKLEPEDFADRFLRPIGTEVVVAGTNFRFGRARGGDLDLLARLGFDARPVPLVESVSSTRIRDLLRNGEVERAARLLGRPPEVSGLVVAGDARGGTLGFPTANIRPQSGVVVPGFGIYAGAAGANRAAISIGTNPHYGGEERRVEAFLLDFEGDLYGQELTIELWARLRDEQAFESEAELVEQIARDVEATQHAQRPV
jgi:riboflavin kinase/FMN adenylyltransferase